MTLRLLELLLLPLLVHHYQTWGHVEVNMEDQVEVQLHEQAMLLCLYNLTEPDVIINWSAKFPNKEPIRLYHFDGQSEMLEGISSGLFGRINVTHTYEPSSTQGSVTLTINNVQISDEREFFCSVESAATKERAEGHTRLLAFNSPSFPEIVGTLKGISVTEIEASKIADCKVEDAYPRPTITWYKNDHSLQQGDGNTKILESVTNNPSGLFTVESELFHKVEREDEDAQFYCEVTYFVLGERRMKESDRINITVNYPATDVSLLVYPSNKLLKEGDTVTIRCKENGRSEGLYSFKHKEEVLESNDERLILNNVSRLQSGEYFCSFFDLSTDLEILGSTNITVHYLDHVVVTPDETVFDQREDVRLTCNALSSLPTHTAWYKDGTRLAEKHILELHNASYHAAGTYTCKVTVPSIPDLRRETSVKVNVRGPPQMSEGIVVGPVNKSDHSVNLTCRAQGFPVPTLTWELVDQQSGQTVPVHHVLKQETNNGFLSIVSVKTTAETLVSCNASNELGTDTDSRIIDASKPRTTTTHAPRNKEAETTVPTKQPHKGGSGVIIAVIIILLLLTAILGSVLYFFYKKGRLPCGRSGKQDFMKPNANKDDIVMEMKSGKSEEAVLLGVNGEKKSPTS